MVLGGHYLLLPVVVGGHSFRRLGLQSCLEVVSIIWNSVAGKPKLPRCGLILYQRYHHHLAMLCFGQASISDYQPVASILLFN